MPSDGKECPHCFESLSREAYYRHKQLYFKNGIWKKKKATKKGISSQSSS